MSDWTSAMGCCSEDGACGQLAVEVHHSRAKAPLPRARVPVALQPPDDLKPRFARGEDDGPKTAFTPDGASKKAAVAAPEAETPVSANAKLLAEIRALQPEELPPNPNPKKKVDLNGIYPRELLLGATFYGIMSTFAWQFTQSTGEYFAANPFESSFYVVQRLTSIARVVLVSLGSLGAGITFFASLGQLALAVQVSIGIQQGELDPTKERNDPSTKRKATDLQKMFEFMTGDKNLKDAGK